MISTKQSYHQYARNAYTSCEISPSKQTMTAAMKMYSPTANREDFDRAEARLKKIEMIKEYRKNKLKSVMVKLEDQLLIKE